MGNTLGGRHPNGWSARSDAASDTEVNAYDTSQTSDLALVQSRDVHLLPESPSARERPVASSPRDRLSEPELAVAPLITLQPSVLAMLERHPTWGAVRMTNFLRREGIAISVQEIAAARQALRMSGHGRDLPLATPKPQGGGALLRWAERSILLLLAGAAVMVAMTFFRVFS